MLQQRLYQPLPLVRRAYWCLDEQQQLEDERRQNSAAVVVWNVTATEQTVDAELQLLGARVSFSWSMLDLSLTTDSQLSMSGHIMSLCWVYFLQLHEPWRSDHHCLSRLWSCFCMRSPRLLQQSIVRYKRRLAEEAAEHCSSHDNRDQKVQPHQTSLAWTSLACNFCMHHPQTGDDGLYSCLHRLDPAVNVHCWLSR